MKKILAITITFSFFGCKNRDEIVVNHQWKFGEGYYLGDFIRFNDTMSETGYYFSNDTIYKQGRAVALVENTSYNVDHYVLHITSLTKNSKGLYFDKGTR